MSRAEARSLPAVVNLATASRLLGISRSQAYDLVKAGRFPVKLVKVGERYRVPTHLLLRLLDLDGDSDDAA